MRSMDFISSTPSVILFFKNSITIERIARKIGCELYLLERIGTNDPVIAFGAYL